MRAELSPGSRTPQSASRQIPHTPAPGRVVLQAASGRSPPMAISVVIPAYNASAFLKETLDSVLAQSFPAWELIVVDDGSTDDTAKIVEYYAQRDKRVKLIRQQNVGTAKARNTGAAAIGDQAKL